MPKSAAQRLTVAQIRAARASGTPVAVFTGFKRGFCEDALQATITNVDCPRTVFRDTDDMIGRVVRDGVAVHYAHQSDAEDSHVVAPSDLLDTWDHYQEELARRQQARAEALEQAVARRHDVDMFAQMLEGIVMNSPAGVLGVFLPFEVAEKVVGNLKGGPG